jgi:hypothetical protein
VAKYIDMGEKQQLTFKMDSDVVVDLDKVLSEFKEITGAKPVRQECIEAAIKDYIIKLRKQIELLKTKNPE